MIPQRYHEHEERDETREKKTRRVDTSERVSVYDKKDKYSSYCANQPE